MKFPYLLACVLGLGLCGAAPADEVFGPPRPEADAKLPITGLAPSKLMPDLCVFKYRISTQSPECQAFFDQGMGFYYSYVWMEAARSFETAAQHDPDCAMTWWALSRAIEKGGPGNATTALNKAKERQASASHKEQLLITARLQEAGQAGGTSDVISRKKAAAKTIDGLLALYEDDEEAWFYRGQLSENGISAIPYYKALLRINPLHPGANHELVHLYEGQRRPALGWKHSENYIKSSPGIPHPFHMQAHLATRLGRWDQTSDRSARAIELERAYHQTQGVRPAQDFQFPHHLEILTVSLIHDGRYKEARAIKEEAKAAGYEHRQAWFKLHLAERDWDEALKIVELDKKNKQRCSYLRALIYLRQGDPERANAEVEVLREAIKTGRDNKELESRLWETHGQLLCRTGGVEGGLKLLWKTVERTKDDYNHHAWGNGAYYMETWGIAALQGGKPDVAEEAFHEALAHDPGSARAALGMQVLCERQGRSDEAAEYAELARRCWRKADPGVLDAELAWLRQDFSLRSKSANN